MTRISLRPGQIAPVSGQYQLVGPRGGQYPQEVTVVRGERVPPTPSRNQNYRLADTTKHRTR